MLAHILELQASQALHKEFGIAFNSYVILFVLKKHDVLNQQYLATKLGISTAAISKRIKNLTDKGYVTTKVNEENRRENLVTLTQEGRVIQEQATLLLKNNFDENVKEFTEQEETDKLLTKLLEILASKHYDRQNC